MRAMRMPSPLKALGFIAAYAVTVGGVGAALIATADDSATPWLALLAAMAIVHLGFGIWVGRWSAALLPLIVCVVAFLLDLGDFSITALLVGIPCAMLLLAGVSLRVGWDGGPVRRARERAGADAPPSEVAEIRAERLRAARAAGEPDPDFTTLRDDAILR
jgi:hypothetical protein